jgi:hypothetical protein
MKVPLTNSSKSAVVDNADAVWACLFKWKVNPDGHVVRDDDDECYLCNCVLAHAHLGDYTLHDQFDPPRKGVTND